MGCLRVPIVLAFWSAAAAAGVEPVATQPIPADVETQLKALAKRYEDVLIPAFKLNAEQSGELRKKLGELVEANAKADRTAKPELERTIAEIAEIESGSDATTLRSQRRIVFLYGRLEQLYLAAPLEPWHVAAAIITLVPKDQYDRAGRVIVDGRQRFILPSAGVTLRDAPPGTPPARVVLALARNRSFKKSGFADGARELPREIDPLDVVKADVPQFFPTAPPPGEWNSCVEGWVVRLGLDANQALAARRIVSDSVKMAEAKLADLKPDLDAAAARPDAEVRAAVLAELKRPLDELFDEMKLRVVHVASADQRERATSRPAGGA